MECPDELIYDKQQDSCISKQSMCDSNPCQSGGICKTVSNDYECECPEGFAGQNCQTEIDACFKNPCGADNTCNVMPPGSSLLYYCECSDMDKYGLSCDDFSEINPCILNKDDKLLPTPIEESVFIQCSGKKLSIMPCPKALVFSFSAQRCDWRSDATTTSSSTQSPLDEILESFLEHSTKSVHSDHISSNLNKKGSIKH